MVLLSPLIPRFLNTIKFTRLLLVLMPEICRPKRPKEEKLTYKTNTKRVVAAGGEVLCACGCVQMCVQKQSCRPKFNLALACLDLPIKADWAGDSLIRLQDLDQLNESSHPPTYAPFFPPSSFYRCLFFSHCSTFVGRHPAAWRRAPPSRMPLSRSCPSFCSLLSTMKGTLI